MNNTELGNVIYENDAKIGCQIFSEGVKKSNFYICVLTDKFLCFRDNETAPVVCDTLLDIPHIIPLDDIEKIIYPSEDKKIMLWIKIKGDRIIRVFLKSTGKYFDIRIGTPKDAKPLYDMLCGLIN